MGAHNLDTTGEITGEIAKVQTTQPSTQVGDLWWDTDDAGNGNVGAITNATDTYQILATDETIICNKLTDFTVTLPTAIVGQIFSIKNIGVGLVTVDGAGSDTIDGALTQDVYQWACLKLQCNAVNTWIII